MSQIIVDASMTDQLRGLVHPVKVCDPSGRVLGRFIPTADLSEWEPVTPDISDAELERRSKSNERRYTTQEMLDLLRKR